ncbi:MAG: flagellar biosynthesis anti-sigma factor FlgM [Oligoflexia bacterium]|nr:flagellar biosynthesis anti-sigma factor FlgM [Oligoflexia bacterium]
MSDVRTDSPTTFFPREHRSTVRTDRSEQAEKISGIRNRNTKKRQNELKETTENDARVDISTKTKDFARIRKAVDAAPDINNKQKIAGLKKQIDEGTYKIDYDQLAEKILENEV